MPDLRPSFKTSLSKTVNRVKERGPREVLSLAIERVRGFASSSDVLVMFMATATAGAEDIEGLSFRRADPADASRYARDIGTDSATSFRKRLSERTACFVVDDGRLLLHASWVTRAGAWTRELRAYLVPPPGDAYIYESFTRGEARGRGIYPFALRQISAWAAEAGVGRLWVAVEGHNAASLRAVTKAGFSPAFELPFARRLGRLTIGDATGSHSSEAQRFVSRSRPLSHL